MGRLVSKPETSAAFGGYPLVNVRSKLYVAMPDVSIHTGILREKVGAPLEPNNLVRDLSSSLLVAM